MRQKGVLPMSAEGEKLAMDHWKYIEDLLVAHDPEIDNLNIIGFHYRTAFEHGFKHGMEAACQEGK
jgi:hypothetical protein